MSDMGAMRITLAVLAVTAAFAAPLVVAGLTADDRPALARSQPEAGEVFSFERGAVPLDRPSRSVDIAVLRRAAALPAMKAPTRRRARSRPAGDGGVRGAARTPPQAPAVPRAPSRSASSDTTPTAPTPARAPAPAPEPAPAPARSAPRARPAPPARQAPAPRAPSKPAPSRPAPDDFDDDGNSFDSTG